MDEGSRMEEVSLKPFSLSGRPSGNVLSVRVLDAGWIVCCIGAEPDSH